MAAAPLTATAGVGKTTFYYFVACNLIHILRFIVFTYFKILAISMSIADAL